jgi:uncharacterized protein DUF6457
MAQPYEAVTDRVAEQIGAHRVEEPEATALLALARRVAQASDDRRAAPLVSYLVGQVTGSEFDPARRAALIDELAGRLFPGGD